MKSAVKVGYCVSNEAEYYFKEIQMIQSFVKPSLFALLVCLPLLCTSSPAQAQHATLFLNVNNRQTSTRNPVNVTSDKATAGAIINVMADIQGDGSSPYSFTCCGGTIGTLFSGYSTGNDSSQSVGFTMPAGQSGYDGGLPQAAPPVQFYCFLYDVTTKQSYTTGYITVP